MSLSGNDTKIVKSALNQLLKKCGSICTLQERTIHPKLWTSMEKCFLLRDGPPKRGDKILLKFMDCAYISDDCGLYAIANAVAKAFDIDPTTQEYDTELMRGHFIHCFEQNEMQLFPARTRKSSYIDGVRYSAYLKIFCTCYMPEDGQYVIYDKCSIWYHPECEGLEVDQIPKSGISYYLKKTLRRKDKIIYVYFVL